MQWHRVLKPLACPGQSWEFLLAGVGVGGKVSCGELLLRSVGDPWRGKQLWGLFAGSPPFTCPLGAIRSLGLLVSSTSCYVSLRGTADTCSILRWAFPISPVIQMIVRFVEWFERQLKARGSWPVRFLFFRRHPFKAWLFNPRH